MSRIRRQAACACAMVTLLGATHAEATTIGLTPATITVVGGESFGLDVTVSDIASGDIISAFDIDVLFDAGALSVTGASFGEHLGSTDPADRETLYDSILSTGHADLAGLSLLSDDDIAALQADAAMVTLATLSLVALDTGVTTLNLELDATGGIDVKGRNARRLTFGSIDSATVNVVARPTQVAGPGGVLSWALCALALVGSNHRFAPRYQR